MTCLCPKEPMEKMLEWVSKVRRIQGQNTKINCVSKYYQRMTIYNKIPNPEVLKGSFNNTCKIFNTENYKIFLRKTKDLNKWKVISCSWKNSVSVRSQVSPNLLLQRS